jgi:magnesium transporter
MPELRWPFGYPLALAIMATAAIVSVTYFRRKGWF